MLDLGEQQTKMNIPRLVKLRTVPNIPRSQTHAILRLDKLKLLPPERSPM